MIRRAIPGEISVVDYSSLENPAHLNDPITPKYPMLASLPPTDSHNLRLKNKHNTI